MNDTQPEKQRYLIYYVPMLGLKTTQGLSANALMRVFLKVAKEVFGGALLQGENFAVGVFDKDMPKGDYTEFERRIASKVFLYDLDESAKAEVAERKLLDLIAENPGCFGQAVLQGYLNNMQYTIRGAEWLTTTVD